MASYVIGEARSPSERRRLVDSLWRRTGGLLVLVEPGTPVGSPTSARLERRCALCLSIPDQLVPSMERHAATCWTVAQCCLCLILWTHGKGKASAW